MPQMGESIAEGTIVRWIKRVGDAIDKDEPLFEISTDKVDAEIPSPGAGVLLEIKVKEGETVPVNSVVAVIGNAGEKASAAEGARASTESPREESESSSAAARASGGGAPRAVSTDDAPTGHSAYEVDFHRIEQLRQARKAAYEAAGTRLTYTGFVAKATIEAMREFPFTNASIDGENIVYKRDINLGIAVALDNGLIVPVIKDA